MSGPIVAAFHASPDGCNGLSHPSWRPHDGYKCERLAALASTAVPPEGLDDRLREAREVHLADLTVIDIMRAEIAAAAPRPEGLRDAYLAGVRRGTSDGMEGYPMVADDWLAASRHPVDPLSAAGVIGRGMDMRGMAPPGDPLREAVTAVERLPSASVVVPITDIHGQPVTMDPTTVVSRAAVLSALRAALDVAAAPRPEGLVCGHPMGGGKTCTERPHGEDRWHTWGHPFEAAAPRPEGLDSDRLRRAMQAAGVTLGQEARYLTIAAEYERLGRG